jgi:hypothetical protein
MGHSRTPTQNTAGDGFPADLIDGYVRASIRASPDKSPTRRLVIEATYDLQGHRPSMQCAACTIDLTTAGKGYAATGRQTPRHRHRPRHRPTSPPTQPASAGGRHRGGRIGGAMRSSPQRANRASPGRCCLRHVPGPGGRSGGVTSPVRAVRSVRRCTQ